jgi:hypothetical protein
MLKMTLAEQLLYTTVKLMAFKDGNHFSTGTGFMFAFAKNGDENVPCIVTNKHVVDGADTIRARLHYGENGQPTGEFVNCDFDISGGLLFRHPDPSVDLCAFTYADKLAEAASQQKEIFNKPLDMSIVPESDDWQYFDALEQVLMIGCPNGLADEINNLPISRRGITATSLTKNYNGKAEFMVDMACFHGSSGSPIFLHDTLGYLDRRDDTYKMAYERIKLVGILYSGPKVANDGRIVLSNMPRVEVSTMMHLGNAIKSSELRVLDEEITEMLRQQGAVVASKI